MEKELKHQGKDVRGERDATPASDIKRDKGASQQEPTTTLPPRRRIRAYERIDYWQ